MFLSSNSFGKLLYCSTTDISANGELELTAIIDGKVKIVTEASGEGSTHRVESHHIPTSAPSTSQPLISPTSRRTNKQESMVPQPRSPTQTPVVDEAASTSVDVRYGGTTTTVTGLKQDKAVGSLTLQELMVLCTTLSKKVESLETDLKQTKLTYGAAYTKLIKKVKKLENKVKKIAEIDQDPAISLVQHDAKIQGRYEHDMEFDLDAAKDVSSAKPVSTAGATITTAGVAAISTASPTRRVSTVDDITMANTLVYIRKSAAKDKERQRIARVHEVASSFNVEEWIDIQARVEADEELAQRLQVEEREMYTEVEQARMLIEIINQRKRYFVAQRAEERRNKPPTQAQQRTYMSNYIKHIGGYTLQQLRGYSFDEIKNLFETKMRRVHTFVPIESEIKRVIPELAAGSSKRDAEEELDQESFKRQKTGESSELAEEPRDKEANELSQEELQ
ncbi:hypothetical protein Tco_0613471 [Tanacetum coccineum]